MIIKRGGSLVRPAMRPKMANNVTQHGRLVAGNYHPVCVAFTTPTSGRPDQSLVVNRCLIVKLKLK